MKLILPSFLSRSALAAGTLASLSAVTSLQAQTTIDWLSTAPNGTWATGTNWVGGVAPTNDTTSNIASFSSASYTTSTILPGTTSVAGLSIGSSSAALTLSAGTLTVGSNIAVASANTTTSTTILAGAASLTKSGVGTLNLNAANTYSGGTTLSAGTLAIGNSAALGTGTINLSGGTIISSTTVNGDRTLANASVVATASTTTTVNAGFSVGNVGGNLRFNGALTGTGTLQTNGTQNRSVVYAGDLSGFQGTISFTNFNNGNNLRVGLISGVANLSNAKLEVLGGSAGINRNFGAIDGVAGTIRIGELSGNGRILSNFGSGINTFEIGNLNTNSTFSGLIANNSGSTAALTKVGTGTLTLSGANTYTGSTTINAGTLKMGASDVFNNGAFVLAGGTLDLNAFSDTVGALTINTTSAINFGSTLGANSLAFADSSAVTWTGILSLLNFEAGIDTLKFGNSAAGLTTGQLGQIDLAGYTATGLDATGVVQFTAVPEPSVVALLVFALGAVVIFRRHRPLA